MTLTDDAKNDFIDTYTRALVSSWSSEEFSQRLDFDPRAAFAEVGLTLPADATIRVVRNLGKQSPEDTSTPTGSLDTQVDLYEEGLRTGVFEFHIPDTPQVDTAELNLDELAGVAGGDIWCCCCPCCCCS